MELDDQIEWLKWTNSTLEDLYRKKFNASLAYIYEIKGSLHYEQPKDYNKKS